MIWDIILGVLRVFQSFLCALMIPQTLVSELCVAHSCYSFLSHVWLFVTLWTAACQASLSFTISKSLLKLMSTESVMPSNHLILCCPLLLLPSVFHNIYNKDVAVVPNLFGTRDWFPRGQFFHGPGVGGRWFQDDSSAFHLLCILFEIECPCRSAIQVHGLEMGDPWSRVWNKHESSFLLRKCSSFYKPWRFPV